MKHLLVASLAFAAGMPAAAHAVTVYPGCAVPSLKPSHHTFFIDPVKGSPSGDGSAAKPWRTLAEVLDTNNKLLSTMGHNARTFSKGDMSLIPVNPTSPIKAGDVLMLKSGNHGDVKIVNSFNSDFVTVVGAPGETPLLSSLTIVSSGKWLFQGLKFMGTNPTPSPVSALVSLARGDWIGTTADIVLDNNKLLSAEDTSSWKPEEWNTKPYSYLLLIGQRSNCVAVTNNTLKNGANGIAFGSDQSLIQGNMISSMRYDGIDFYGSNQTIRGNTIKDSVWDAATSTLHPDGIQGWSIVNAGVETVNRNDVIDSNFVVNTRKPTQSQTQGISIFDGTWDNLKITNNVVITNTWNGIVVGGGSNVSIMNNTVLASDAGFTTWLAVGKSKKQQPGQNVVVRNNIASNMVIGYPQAIYDHNVIANKITLMDMAKKQTFITKGAIGNANRIVPSVMNGFVAASPGLVDYNLRLRPTSVAIAAGSNVSAPDRDILDKKRSTPFDLGAYQH